MPLTDDFMLPRRVRTMEQMADLLQAEEAEISQTQRTIDAMAAQLAVCTSTFLLPRHERIFGLPVNTGESLEVRRARVLARLNTRGVTTVQAIREMVQIVTGREGDVTEHFADYAFSVAVHLLFSDSTDTLGELIRQIDEIKPAHLLFDTIASLQPVALENRQQLCFAALTAALRHRNSPSGIGRVSLLLPVRAGNRSGAALAFSLQARVRQPTVLELGEFLVGRYRVNNLGVEEILLDGKHPLDGGWRFTPTFRKGIKLSHFKWGGGAVNRQDVRGGMTLRAQAQNAQNAAAGGIYRAFGENGQAVRQQGFTVAARVRNAQNLRGAVTAQADRKLDGTFLLDGTKRLDAGTIRSEL